MTVRTAVAAAAKELAKPNVTPPTTWTLLCQPDEFEIEGLVVTNKHDIVYGRPALLGRLSETKQNSSHRGFAIYGQWDRDNSKRLSPVNEVWLVCVSSPIRPGESGSQTSLVTVELKKGKMTPELGEQIGLFYAHFGAGGYIDSPKK